MDTCDLCYEVNGNPDCDNCYLGNPCLDCPHYNIDCNGQCYSGPDIEYFYTKK